MPEQSSRSNAQWLLGLIQQGEQPTPSRPGDEGKDGAGADQRSQLLLDARELAAYAFEGGQVAAKLIAITLTTMATSHLRYTAEYDELLRQFARLYPDLHLSYRVEEEVDLLIAEHGGNKAFTVAQVLERLRRRGAELQQREATDGLAVRDVLDSLIARRRLLLVTAGVYTGRG